MNYLNEQYEIERRADELRAAQREAEIKALLDQAKPHAPTKNIRQIVGGKLIALGELLQDIQPAPKPSTSRI